MAHVIAGMTMSLDGFVSDRSGSVGPLYADLGNMGDDPRAAESISTTGAVVMGRRTFEMASDPDSYADTYEFQVPLFIVSRHPPASHPKENDQLTMTFVGDGAVSAVRQAKVAAGAKNVVVVGGPRTIQSLLKAGEVDELQIDIVPILLEEGLRLLENLAGHDIRLERIGVDLIPTGRTGLRFAVKK